MNDETPRGQNPKQADPSGSKPKKTPKGRKRVHKKKDAGKKKTSFLLLAIVALIFAVLGAGGFWYLGGTEGGGRAQLCTYKDKTYENSENFSASDNCNECFCNNGRAVCTLLFCVG